MPAINFKIDTTSLQELTAHRTTTLPLACYKTDIRQHVQGHIPLHWHDELQFVLMLHGSARFQIYDQELYVQQGDGLFINSGSLHIAEAASEGECTYICLNVAAHFITAHDLYAVCVHPYVQATNLPFIPIPCSERWGSAILQGINELWALLQERPPFFEMELAVRLASMWQHLITSGFQPRYSQAEMIKNERIKQMLEWIHIHYAEKVTLDELAHAGQLSRAECCRYFRRFFKTTPLNYVTDYRVGQSLILLQQDQSVTEAAYQVGFNSTSYFIERFRKVMHMTPLAYKKQMQDDESNRR